MAGLLQVIQQSVAWHLLDAAAIGLIIGIERERSKVAGRQADAGIRTFTLISLMGGLAAQTNSSLVMGAAVIFAVGLAFWTGVRAKSHAQAMTTRVAMVIAAILGVLAQSLPAEAIAAAIVVVLVISSRAHLHRFARDWLTEQEVQDGLLFALAALVVLPLLPDRAIDPLRLVNPFVLWRLGVVLMGVSAFSHFATRIIGPRYGMAISGFAGGFVSSTATIAAMGSRARDDRQLDAVCASGAAASILGSLLFLAILVAAANPEILRPLVVPFSVAALFTLGYAALLAWHAMKARWRTDTTSRAFGIRTALVFVGLVCLFSLLSWALITWVGDAVLYASVIGTALIDAHAAAVSIATLVAGGKLDAGEGALAILIGFSANMLAKAPTAFALGRVQYGARVTLGLCLLVAGLWIGYACRSLI